MRVNRSFSGLLYKFHSFFTIHTYTNTNTSIYIIAIFLVFFLFFPKLVYTYIKWINEDKLLTGKENTKVSYLWLNEVKQFWDSHARFRKQKHARPILALRPNIRFRLIPIKKEYYTALWFLIPVWMKSGNGGCCLEKI